MLSENNLNNILTMNFVKQISWTLLKHSDLQSQAIYINRKQFQIVALRMKTPDVGLSLLHTKYKVRAPEHSSLAE